MKETVGKQVKSTMSQQAAGSDRKWYLFVYDVREGGRLRRLHYFIRKRGVSLQKSVFLLRVDSAGMQEILSGTRLRIDDEEDDVRLYPVLEPNAIWTAGRQGSRLLGLHGPAPQQPASRLSGFFRRLLGGKG